MARRSRRRYDTGSYRNAKTYTPSLALPVPIKRPRILPRVELVPIADRRRHHPNRLLQPLSSELPGRRLRPLVVRPSVTPAALPGGKRGGLRQAPPHLSPKIRFAVPEKTVRCIRRKRRREVLFASGKTNGRARKRRNQGSDVTC